MKDLNERIREMKEASKAVPVSGRPAVQGVPKYNADGTPTEKQQRNYGKFFKIFLPIIASVLLLTGIIYLPQCFMKDHVKENAYLVEPNYAATTWRNQFVMDSKMMDFDDDGLTNEREYQSGTDPYQQDSDGDHTVDSVDKTPLHPDSEFKKAVVSAGAAAGSSYEVNGVILWPDSDEATAYGVAKTLTGYHFSGFTGWAKFPNGNYAYEYKDGIHRLLDHRNYENAWKISGDCQVVVTEKPLETTNHFSFFGLDGYLGGFFGDVVAFVFPDKGWITGTHMTLSDTYIDTSEHTTVKSKVGYYNTNDHAHLMRNDNTLDKLAGVYQSIQNDKPVFASLYHGSVGEAIVMVYGYTNEGHLLVADPSDTAKTTVLEVNPTCDLILTKENNVGSRDYFTFVGCGYTSENGATIAFIASLSYDPAATTTAPKTTTTTTTTTTTAVPGETAATTTPDAKAPSGTNPETSSPTAPTTTGSISGITTTTSPATNPDSR